MKRFLRILYILIFVFAGAFVFIHPVKTETNILRAVFSDNTADEIVVKLSGRYSSKINVIAEAGDSVSASAAAEKFLQSVDKEAFEVKDFDFSKFLETYSAYHKNLLSAHTARKLEKHNYDDITAEAYGRLFDPLGVTLLPLNEDPFMLFADYLQSLGNNGGDEFFYNDKYYKIISLEVKNDSALSPELLNGKIKNLVNTQKNLSDDKTRIYLTGAPIHSYYASSKSMFEINLICAISAIFVIGLCLFYFKSLKPLVPIAASLGTGILSGYLVSALVFPSVHVLTFVFSTTLIGICIDYSLHYFIEKDLSKIFKSLTVSMISTVSAFAVLLFSGVELLRQIAVFTIAGLFSVYLIVVLFYPLLKIDFQTRKINFSLSEKAKKIFATAVICAGIGGMFFVKFNDDIRNMYVPSKELAAAETLFTKVTGGDKKTSFAVVEGRNFQDLLHKEEWISQNLGDVKFQALSKFVPSEKQQKKNFELHSALYKNSLKTYAEFLPRKDVEKLLNESAPQEFLNLNKNLPLEEFLIGENTSVMVLYDFDRPEIVTQNGGKYVDVRRDISERIKACRETCVRMLLPVFVILFLLLSLIYTPRNSAKILAPSILAGGFSIGLLAIFGQDVNLFHILAIFLIIGFGLDYSVFRAGGEKHSKDAVLLSCATSVFSFMLLAFTSFKLISSLGFILAVGLSVSYLTSLLFEYGEDK